MRIVQAPRGTQLSARSWLTEAPLRMLMNNLDPEVAERPEDLVVYGGIGKAARNWDSFDRIVETLRRLNLDESLLVQSGKPVGVFKTHPDAPRVLIANSNLVPRWATWEHFNELDRKGLMMYGQMTAGSWIYIGSQGIVQGTYETFAEAGRQHYAGDWSGKWILSAGLGGMGGAQPLAATIAGASMLVIECDPSRIERRLKTGYLDKKAANLDEATAMLENTNGPVSVGLQGNAAELLPKILEISRTTQFRPALVTDQTSAHDPANGYLPEHWSLDKWKALRRTQPEEVALSARESIARHVRAILGFKAMGIPCVDYGNNIRQQARDAGLKNAFDYPGFVPAYIRPMFCAGRGPFRWVALSGDPADIARTDARMKDLFSQDKALLRWLDLAGKKISFQGLPARICWLRPGERPPPGPAFHPSGRKGGRKGPAGLGPGHPPAGPGAHPHPAAHGVREGSDAIADWPILNALLNASSGATWVSVHHGGGVGIGYSLHAGMVIVADGTPDADEKLERVLTCDPGIGVVRHADAGYSDAIETAEREGLRIPMREEGAC